MAAPADNDVAISNSQRRRAATAAALAASVEWYDYSPAETPTS